jgi:energy-converting hydrogenase A subunit R
MERLDEIFWETIDEMQIGIIYSEVNPIGGCEKVEAIKDVVKKLKAKLTDVMYVGDSITDEEALRFTRENDGLAVSFNGNRYAIENADIAVMSEDSIATAIIADVFIRLGKEETLSLVANWSPQTLVRSLPEQELVNSFLRTHSLELPKAKIITEENMENLTSASTEFRKKVRGVAIGRMG